MTQSGSSTVQQQQGPVGLTRLVDVLETKLRSGGHRQLPVGPKRSARIARISSSAELFFIQ